MLQPGESGHSRAEAPGSRRIGGQEATDSRPRETMSILQRERGRRGEEEEEEERGRGRRRDGGRRGGRRAESEGARWTINQLLNHKLDLTSSHNQEVCRLQAELTCLRAALERGEAQRAELQYQLSLSQRRVTEREADHHALQQEVEQRHKLVQSLSVQNQELTQLLQEQVEALDESERRMMEVKAEREKEAELHRRQAGKLKEREERSRRASEVCEQRLRSLQCSLEAERAAHLGSKSDLELLRNRVREVERETGAERERGDQSQRALQWLQAEYDRCQSNLSVAVETGKATTFDLSERLQEEKTRHGDTHALLEQALRTQSDIEESHVKFVQQMRETLLQLRDAEAAQVHDGNQSPAAQVHDGNQSPAAQVHDGNQLLQLLQATLLRREETDKQAQALQQELTSDLARQTQLSIKLEEEVTRLRQESSDWSTQSRRLEEEVTRLRQESSDWSTQSQRLEEEVTRLHQMSSDWSTQNQRLEEGVTRLRQESSDWSTQNQRLEEEVTRLRQESSDWSTQSRRLEAELQREREERASEVQRITLHYEVESKRRLSFLYCLYQRLLVGVVLLTQPESMLGDFTWAELCDVISEQAERLTSDLRESNEKMLRLQRACEQRSACVRALQRHHQVALAGAGRREEAWRRQRDALRDHASSLTSDLRVLLLACARLGGALGHAHHRLRALCQQKRLLSRRLDEREELEQEVRRLGHALSGGEGAGPEGAGPEGPGPEGKGRGWTVAAWRRSAWAVLALRRWSRLARESAVERGGWAMGGDGVRGGAEAVGGAALGNNKDGDGSCWLRSESLSSTILSCRADLQGALTHTGSGPSDLQAARSSLSRLLGHLLDQSQAEEPHRPTPPRADMKALVSTLQRHFLLFSQRLHSAEVERRSLRAEAANQRRARGKEDDGTMVSAERFHGVCEELRQALTREQEVQTMTQEQKDKVQVAQQQLRVKERALRILGKHLLGVQRDRKQLQEELLRCKQRLMDGGQAEWAEPPRPDSAPPPPDPAPSEAPPKKTPEKKKKKSRGGRR